MTAAGPSHLSVAANANTNMVRLYLNGRFVEEIGKMENWQVLNYGTAYLSFLKYRLLTTICTNHLGMVLTSPSGLRAQTPSGQTFGINDVAEWAGIKARRFSEMRHNWKRAEDTLMFLRQEANGSELGAGLPAQAKSDRNRLFKILDLLFQDGDRVLSPITELPPTAFWVRDAVTITMTELIRKIDEVGVV
jgi:hypothetical protein